MLDKCLLSLCISLMHMLYVCIHVQFSSVQRSRWLMLQCRVKKTRVSGHVSRACRVYCRTYAKPFKQGYAVKVGKNFIMALSHLCEESHVATSICNESTRRAGIEHPKTKLKTIGYLCTCVRVYYV